jgi:uncharacterized membrane protein YgcG
LTPELEDLDDMVAVQPWTIEFKMDSESPAVITMGQRYRGSFKELNPNLVTYVPVDDELYGRPPVAPALQVLPFWLRFYYELQVYLHHAAWGFIDGNVDSDKLLEMWNNGGVSEETKAIYADDFFSWATAKVKQLAADYKGEATKDPDALLAHLNLLELSAVGRGAAQFPVAAVAELCKKEIYASLKMLPVFMGSNDTVAESHATVQMEIFNSGLQRFQDMVKHIIERNVYIGLQAQGYPKEVVVCFEFKTLATEDRFRAARAAQIEATVAAFKRDQGWISQDEASIEVTGSEAVGDPIGPVVKEQTSQAITPTQDTTGIDATKEPSGPQTGESGGSAGSSGGSGTASDGGSSGSGSASGQTSSNASQFLTKDRSFGHRRPGWRRPLAYKQL